MVWQLLTWPLDGLLWIAETIDERASAEFNDKESLQKRLTALQIRLDLGDITEADYVEQEEVILEAMEAQLDQAQKEKEEEDIEDG